MTSLSESLSLKLKLISLLPFFLSLSLFALARKRTLNNAMSVVHFGKFIRENSGTTGFIVGVITRLERKQTSYYRAHMSACNSFGNASRNERKSLLGYAEKAGNVTRRFIITEQHARSRYDIRWRIINATRL